MTLFGSIGFLAPFLLIGLLVLPLLWLILRAVPPSPVRRVFPGVVLLLGLKDDDQTSDRTPWWLLLMRLLAVAAVIIGMAGPILNPRDQETDASGANPLLIVLDASWASAADWPNRLDNLESILTRAARENRRVAVLRLSTPETPTFQSAQSIQERLPGFAPEPWQPNRDSVEAALAQLPAERFDTFWFSDGLSRPSRETLLDALLGKGSVRVFESPRNLLTLAPPQFEDGTITLKVQRLRPGPMSEVNVSAQGTDPAGNRAVLARSAVQFASGTTEAEVSFTLPSEMRARITRFEIDGQRSAGAVSLPDDGLRRREVALIAGQQDREGLELLKPLHYLTKALEPSADILNGSLIDILPANPDVVAFADVATLAAGETQAVLDWVEAGGTLVRFAGPRLAASDVSRETEDALMPVRLRAGGRTVGGAMSWGEPKTLAEFSADSPFFGLDIPADVNVTAQVMAQPDPTLADRVVAQLSDGTPLVTRKRIGQGQVVLFHVTANAEWSSLPLSGLFVQMLERLAISAVPSKLSAEDLAGTTWQAQTMLNGFGRLEDAGQLPGVPGEDLVVAPLGPDMPPGVYEGADRKFARNVITSETRLAASQWPSSVTVEGLDRPEETPLAGYLLALAIALLLADVVASLALSGRLRMSASAASLLALVLLMPDPSAAQSNDSTAIAATSELRLAHVLTGEDQVDDLAHAGLFGLSETLFFRTSIEPGEPVAVDLERDELAFFPILYWPITTAQPTPSDSAYAKLNVYLRSGGMILFDTRDADIARFGTGSPNGRKLQALAAPLDIPALEPVPEDHVLTRTFYLLQDFPGRHISRDVWVEAAPPDAELIEGMPFRNLNDNVTPIVIGGNDWAAAWATDERGNPLVPVGSGFAGERQREIALRFGVNLIMHVLTGNYKSDQVHVPALLDRLGQ